MEKAHHTVIKELKLARCSDNEDCWVAKMDDKECHGWSEEHAVYKFMIHYGEMYGIKILF